MKFINSLFYKVIQLVEKERPKNTMEGLGTSLSYISRLIDRTVTGF